MKRILNENCQVIYCWYDHLILRENGDAKIVQQAIADGDYDTFIKMYKKYPDKTVINELGQQYYIVYFPSTAEIWYNDEIIGSLDITNEIGFSMITSSEYECG